MGNEAKPTKVFRVVLMVLDLNGRGRDGVIQELENVEFARVAQVDERTVLWTDEHHLNKRDGWVAYLKGLFL